MQIYAPLERQKIFGTTFRVTFFFTLLKQSVDLDQVNCFVHKATIKNINPLGQEDA